MTDLLEDRLRRSLSAVADSTSIPAVPEPGSLAVVRPIRRRVVFGTAGVGIAAAVTAIAVVMSGGTDLAGPRAGTPKAPAPLSELQASAAADCVTGQASLQAEQHSANPSLAAGQGESYDDSDVDPRLAPDLLYVAPASAGAPLATLDVARLCNPSFATGPVPVRAVARVAKDGRSIVATATVLHPSADDARLVPDLAGKLSVQGAVAHLARIGGASSGIVDVWWTGSDGVAWIVKTSGLGQQAAVSFADQLTIDGGDVTVTAAGWTDLTEPATAVPAADYDVTTTYGLKTNPTYSVAVGHVAGGAELEQLPAFPQDLVRVGSIPALLTRFPNNGIAQVAWEPRPGVSISVQGPVPAGGSTSSLIAFADSLRLVAPGDPALVPVPTSSSSAATATP